MIGISKSILIIVRICHRLSGDEQRQCLDLINTGLWAGAQAALRVVSRFNGFLRRANAARVDR
jgi:hypothetical protein